MIPKKIHYCWFSGNPIPDEFERYIETWKKFCPDYEIIRWDESNYNTSKNQYMKDAYKEARWGFVPDYARFDIIYSEGGFYLDTDVELLKSLDALLEEKAFIGFENESMISAGLIFGAEKGNRVIKHLRDMYDHMSFYDSAGNINLTPSPVYITKEMAWLGVKLNNSFQQLKDITVFPMEWFSSKNYYTGEVCITRNTYSIHHYSCTWMSKKEKLEEEIRKQYCVKYGDFIGNRVDGIMKRLRKINSIEKINARNSSDFRTRWIEHFRFQPEENEHRLSMFAPNMENYIEKVEHCSFLSPAVKSKNVGDEIIERYAMKELGVNKTKGCHRISTHYYPSGVEMKRMMDSDLVMVLGSNLLSGHVQRGQWKLPKDFNALRNICLLGCGWSNYEDADEYSIRFYQKILSNKRILHSVRDTYTEKKLNDLGIENVIYTGCPSMWGLNEKVCNAIPQKKANAVVTALTYYQEDRENDSIMMEELLKLYDTVYFWPQGIYDEKYLKELITARDMKKVKVLKRELNEYESLLRNTRCDYVGNRLHAGIFAMNMSCRSLIIGIDNRAVEISHDTSLPMILREDLAKKMRTRILEEERTMIHMPWENIKRWRKQFEDEL